MIVSLWTGIVHLMLAILGTFILKRFPTSFSIGFLLGVLLVIANQNLIFFGTFRGYGFGVTATNHAFGSLGLIVCVVLAFFAALLFHFKKHIVVAPIDAKGFGRSRAAPSGGAAAATDQNYQQQSDDDEDNDTSDA